MAERAAALDLPAHRAARIRLLAGVFTGSAAWWLLLSAAIGRWRERFDATWRRRVNRGSAALLVGLALWPWLAGGR